jgi:hypothetical protein
MGFKLGEIYEGMVITEELLLVFTLFWLIPLIMAFLVQILKFSVNRWVNIILGILWAILWIADSVEGGILLSQYLINISMIIVAVLIIWHAWKWPKAIT